MRILQIIPVFTEQFGGTTTVVKSISKELAKRHEVVVYTTNGFDTNPSHDFAAKCQKENGYVVFYFKRIRNLTFLSSTFGQMNISIDMINQIRANLKHFEVVHVHSWEQFPEILASYYAKKFSVPYVLQVHGSLHNYDSRNRLKQSYKMIFGDRVLQGASRLIAFNETEAEEYLAMHAPKDRIRIIPNGVDFSNYENLPPQGNFKRFYNIGKDKKIILYLGRVNARKGIDFLVQGYYHFVKTTKRSDTLLVIAGPDDGYLSHIKSLVQTLGLSDLVLFTGLLSSDLKVYAYVDSTICVCLSPFEPFGVVTLEAAVCGKPVIVSKESPIASVVEEAKFGIAVEFNRIDKLAEILDSHLKNTEALEIMGQRGRKFVFDNYRSSEIVHKLENVYEELG